MLAHDCLCRYVQRFVCGCWCACVHARLSPLEPPLRRRTAAAARDRFSRTSLIVTRAVAAINLIKVLWSRWYDARFTRERSRVRVPLELLFCSAVGCCVVLRTDDAGCNSAREKPYSRIGRGPWTQRKHLGRLTRTVHAQYHSTSRYYAVAHLARSPAPCAPCQPPLSNTSAPNRREPELGAASSTGSAGKNVHPARIPGGPPQRSATPK